MRSDSIKQLKWYYKLLQEFSELFELGNKVAEFFEKIHRIFASAIETAVRVVPPLAVIVTAIGHIAVICQLADKQQRKENYVTIGARLFSGVVMLALAVTALVLVQYSMPLLLAATAVEAGLSVFKTAQLKLHIKALQKQLLTLNNSPEHAKVEQEICELQYELKEHQQKVWKKTLEVSYTLVATALVVVGLAIPVTAPFVAAAVAIVSIAYTGYRYRASIQRFFARAKALFKRLVQRLSPQRSSQPSPAEADQESDVNGVQQQDSIILQDTHADYDSEGVAFHAQETLQPRIQVSPAIQSAHDFLSQQEQTLETVAAMQPHPTRFAEAHLHDLQLQQQADFLQHEQHALEQVVALDEQLRCEPAIVTHAKEEVDDDDGGEEGEGGSGESGGDSSATESDVVDDAAEDEQGGGAEEQLTPTLHH